MSKSWITKAEEKQIISSYEGFKGEIVPHGDPNEHQYEIITVRKSGNGSLGLITIFPENSPEHDYPRILVRHSDAKGKRVFIDVWNRDYKGQIYWRFRNPTDVPLSDRDAIAELELKLSSAEAKIFVLEKKYKEIVDTSRLTKPAGRKPHPEELDEKASRVKELLDQGLGEKEILEQMDISRATYYRLKKRPF